MNWLNYLGRLKLHTHNVFKLPRTAYVDGDVSKNISMLVGSVTLNVHLIAEVDIMDGQNRWLRQFNFGKHWRVDHCCKRNK